MTITLSGIKPEVKVFESSQDRLPLPFPALKMIWHNGSPFANKASGAQYFGGIQASSDKVIETLKEMGIDTLPSYFVEAEWTGKKETSYMAWSSRSIWAAPIRARIDWYIGKDYETQQDRQKHDLDFLLYLADFANGKPVPWGYAVLTAHTNAATEIEKAFKNFAKETESIRARVAPGIDPMFFYHCIGTFGTARKSRPVGTGSATIVPAELKSPQDGWTEEILNNIFVGEEIAALMVQAQIESKEWFEDKYENKQKKSDKPSTNLISFAAPENFVGEEGPDGPPF